MGGIMAKKKKLFYLSEEEVELIEHEAKKRGISQSELIKQLLSNLDSSYNYNQQKLEKLEKLFDDIKKIHKENLKQNRLISKAIRYLINEDERLHKKIMYKAKERGDYSFADFLLS